MRKLSAYGPSVIVLLTAAIVLFAGPAAVRQLTYEQTRVRVIQASDRLADNDVLAQINQAYRDIALLVEPSVVHVSAQYIDRDPVTNLERLGLSTGSGWVYDGEGHIVTNHHVIANAQRIEVQLYTGELRDAELVGSDQTTDVAVIKISPERIHPATLGDPAESVNQGDMVFAFGSPFDFRFSMSSGVVSGKGRSVGVIRDEMRMQLGYENFIQVDAAINPGNSGGPLTDYRGRVIGMNTAIATGRRASMMEEGQFAGIGLAIPLDMIEPAVRQIIKYGFVEKGFLGVDPRELTASLARQRQFIGSGVYVLSVEADKPAAAAGVLPGDIVTHVNRRAVASVPQLRSMVSSMLPGETAALTIWRYDEARRQGSTLQIEVPLIRLDTLLTAGQLPPDQPLDAIPQLGIARMSTNTPRRAEQLEVEFREGVLLEELVPGSMLARRVVEGSVIIAVMDRPVKTAEEFVRVLRDFNLRLPAIRATVVGPDGEPRSVSLRVE